MTTTTTRIGPRQQDALACIVDAGNWVTANLVRDTLLYDASKYGTQQAHALLNKLVASGLATRTGDKFSQRPGGVRSQVMFKVTSEGRRLLKQLLR